MQLHCLSLLSPFLYFILLHNLSWHLTSPNTSLGIQPLLISTELSTIIICYSFILSLKKLGPWPSLLLLLHARNKASGNVSSNRRACSVQVSNISLLRNLLACWKSSKAALLHLDFSEEALFYRLALRQKTWSYFTSRDVPSLQCCCSFALMW